MTRRGLWPSARLGHGRAYIQPPSLRVPACSGFRALGRHAFELPEIEAKATSDVCERWATHLLVRSPVPDGPWDQGDASQRSTRREFVSALHYATNLRKTEHGYVTKSLHDLRQAIWAFVHGLNQTLSAKERGRDRVAYSVHPSGCSAAAPPT